MPERTDTRVDPPVDGPSAPASDDVTTIETHWNDLVTTALLGTDRRDPPPPPGPLAELVADTARAAPSERMLAQVAACAAVRRAGVLPGPSLDPLAAPDADPRPPCVPAAVDRWRHISVSWPVLEDEWQLTLIANRWRIAPELVPAMLLRHRGDPVRRTRTMVGAGAVGRWLVEHVADLAARHTSAAVTDEEFSELPPLPIPADLAALLDAPGDVVGRTLADGLGAGAFGAPHRAVLINLIARIRTDALAEAATVLAAVDPTAPGHGLASVLADLAITRHRMLDELSR